MKLMNKCSFWLSFSLLSLVAALLSYTYMDKVYSLVNISITADKQQVFDDAKKLALELDWDLKDYNDVTSFNSQDDLQCFVELEAGGKDAFVEMFQSGAYYPYHWKVRFFKEKQVEEMSVLFSPEGKRLGYSRKLSEQTPGAALTKDQAQKLGENQVVQWCSNFKNYKLIEYDSEVKDSGRVDHNFTYERVDIVVGKGFYRFSIVICGDIVTKLEPSVKVPDNFMRRYQQMRSANSLLSSVGSFFFRSLYILFFGLIGFIFFYRRNYLLLWPSSFAALVVAGGVFLKGLNDFPLWWASYNTIQSSATFVLMQFFMLFMNFLFLFSMIFLTLSVAEAAGRFIYKKHIQFFQIFSLSAASSLQIAQQVVYGYLMVPFMFAYVVGFGYLMKTYFSWWSPAGSLFDPNVIASVFPWFGALAISLQAGFFEEVVCRALPLAMTAVLTRNSKNRKIWFVGMFLFQALIFGALHANYPNQPFYARLIELILPSFGFGWMYLNFGLLPGVITHFVYDVVWFAMPIFISNLFWSKVMIVLLAGVPLWVVVAMYLYNKKLYVLPIKYFNEAFHAVNQTPPIIKPRRIGEEIPDRNKKLILALGLCGFGVWATTYKFCPDAHHLQITKAQAIEIARKVVEDQFKTRLDETWTPIALTQDDCKSTESRFVWQTYGRDAYNLMQGSYISGVNWRVRFVQFSGAVEDRGEEYGAVISSSNLDQHTLRKPFDCYAGHVLKVGHQLPEHFVGADISEKKAQDIVNKFIKDKYALDGNDLNLISVNSDKFDERRDWTVVMQDLRVFDFALEGQARIKVKVSGDKVSEYSRFVFVPEDWVRADQARVMNLGLVKTGLWLLMFILIVFGCIFGLSRLVSSRLGLQMIRHKGLFIAVVSLIYTINTIPFLIGYFNTAAPFYYQLTNISLGMITQVSWEILFCSVFLSIGAVGFIRGKKTNIINAIILSIATAFIILGTSSLISYYEPFIEPFVGNHMPISHWSSLLSLSGSFLKSFYLVLSLVVAMFIVLKTLQDMWPNHLWMRLLCSIIFWLPMGSLQGGSSVLWVLLHGVVLGLVVYLIYYLLLQYDMTLLSLVFGALTICIIVPELLCPSYVGASFDAVITIGIIVITSLFFYKRAHQE